MTPYKRSIRASTLLHWALLVGLGLNSGILKAQPVPFDWQSPVVPNASYPDDTRDIAVDTVNNFVYAVGVVYGGAPYGMQAFNGSNAHRDGFLVKLNLDGSLVWAKTFGSAGSDELNAVTIGPDGNIYVTGSFQNSISLGTSSNTVVSISSAGASDILVASYAPSDGSLIWIKSVAGSQGDDRGTGIVALTSGVFITGDYRRRIYFNGSNDPTSETHNSQNVFIAKYTLSGSFVSSCSGGTDGNDYAGKLTTDGTSLYTIGTVQDDEDFRWRNPNGTTGAYWNDLNSTNSMFVLRVDQSCSLNWARYITNPGSENVTFGAIAADHGSCGNIYLAGATHKNSVFPSNGTTNLPGNPHDFLFLVALAKTNGNTAWLRTAKGPVNHMNVGLDIDVGPKGEVYLAGSYTNQIIWDDGMIASGSSGKEMFAARFTSYGESEWFMPITGANDDVLRAIAAGKNGALFLGGFSNTNDLFIGRVSDTQPALWPTNPTNFNLPAERCQTLGSLNLNSLVVSLHGGNAVSVVSNVGLSNISAALGVPDGNGIQFNTNGSTLVVDLSEELDAGSTLQLVWRKATGASGTAIPKLDVSANGSTWIPVPVPPTTISESFKGGNFELPIAARYVRVQKDNSISSTPFVLDAFQYKAGALSGGTWSGPGVSGSTFDPAGLTGPKAITYTVACYSTTKVIQIDPPSVGGTLSGGGSTCMGSGMELSLAGNTGSMIIWNLSTDGGTSWSNDTTGLSNYTAIATLPATRVRARSISGSCAGATSNTVQVLAADNVAPVISGCPSNITVYTSATSCSATVNYTMPTATDNCPGPLTIVPQNAAHASGSQFTRGNTSVIIRASDNFGNVSTCNFAIQVIDTIKPSLACPPPVTVSTNAGCTATGVELGTPVASDICGVTVTNNAPAIFPSGLTNVIWTATDASGNKRTCTQTVNVNDNTPPNITCPADKTVSTTSGCAAVGVALGTPVTSDNCAIALVNNNATATFPVGMTTVTWTVMDNAGNTNTCTQRITVVDNTPPTITCPPAIQVNANAGCEAVNVALGLPVAADNCDLASLTNDAPAVFPMGTTIVTWTAVDASNNMTTCTQSVQVKDNIPPSISCPANVSATTNSGCNATGVSLGTPIATDNCTGVTVTNNAPTAFPKGTTTVTWTATDASGNVTTCTQTVTVTDNVPPSISCAANVQVNTNAGCTATGVNLGTPTVTDNCTGVTVSNNAPASFPKGTTNVTWTATDASGNATTCTQTVTVTDNVLPTISCPPNVQAHTNAGCTATGVILGTPIANDNCTGITVTNNAPTAFPKGNTTVTWTVTDASGNTAACTQIVTVTDNVLPTISCPSNVQANTNSGCTATGVNLGSPTVSDNCTGVTVTNNAPSAFPKGTTTVTWTATDASSNTSTCTQTVTVTDNIVPTITCPPNVQTTTNNGCTATGVNLGIANATDNCTGVTLNNNAPTAYPIGTTTVTWTATDASGNTATCAQIVTVTDVIAPVITSPANIQTATNTGCTATGVSLGTPTYSDNCTGTTVSNNAPLVFPLGNTTVTWTATDAVGNSSSSTQTVTVSDHTDPIALCREVTLNVDGTGWAHVTTTMVDNGSSDNCTLASMSVLPQDFNSLGDFEVTLTVTDAAGNSAICSTIVHVVDNSPPVAICTDITVYLDATGDVSILAQELDGGSIDNDSIVAFNASRTHFTCADIGTFMDTLFVTDNGGNTSFCIAQVNVIDTVAPTALGQNISVYLDGSGEATIVASDLDNSSSDACGSLTFSASDSAFSCVDIGVMNVTLTVADASGNSASYATQVTVLDTVAPQARCQSVTAYLDASGYAHISALDVDAGSTDNCAISNRVVEPSVLQGAGDHTVQLIVTDGSGNGSNCTAVITVLDTVPPVALCNDTLLQLGNSGTVTIHASDLDGGSMDNDGITQWSASQLVFGCTAIGVNTDTLFVTDVSGNTSFCISTITVVDPFPANAGMDSTADFCISGASTALFPYLGSVAQPGGNWSFQGQSTTGMFDPAQDTPGAYLYTVMNTSGCQVDSSVVIATVHAMGNPGQDTSITVCSSDTAFALVDLLPGADPSGTWSNASGWFNPATDVAGVFLYTVDGPAVCPTAAATVTIQVNTAPNAGTAGSLTLCADAPPTDLFQAMQGSPDPGGEWSDPMGQHIAGWVDPANMSAGSYTYTVVGLTPCAQASSNVVVSFTPIPSAAWTSPDPLCTYNDILDLSTLVIGVSGGTWSGPGVNAGGSQFDPGNVTTQGASTSIQLTYTATENGCEASAVGTIVLLATPMADAGDDASVCGLETNMNASASFGSGQWSATNDLDIASVDASNTAVHVSAPGTYEMHWTVANGQCTSTDNVLLTFHIPEQLGDVDAGPDESWNIKRSFTLQGVADGATGSNWTFLGGSGSIVHPEELSTEVKDLGIGSNTFMLSAWVGACPARSDTVILVVHDLFIPSGYSPNGDGVNDNFEIIGIDVYRDNELVVFNRWGQVVYQAVGYANEWNGRGTTGSLLLDDTYFYVLKFNGDATYNGQVIIKR